MVAIERPQSVVTQIQTTKPEMEETQTGELSLAEEVIVFLHDVNNQQVDPQARTTTEMSELDRRNAERLERWENLPRAEGSNPKPLWFGGGQYIDPKAEVSPY